MRTGRNDYKIDVPRRIAVQSTFPEEDAVIVLSRVRHDSQAVHRNEGVGPCASNARSPRKRRHAMGRGPRIEFIVLLVGLLLPVLAWAQGSSGIAGVVRDTTGA